MRIAEKRTLAYSAKRAAKRKGTSNDILIRRRAGPMTIMKEEGHRYRMLINEESEKSYRLCQKKEREKKKKKKTKNQLSAHATRLRTRVKI